MLLRRRAGLLAIVLAVFGLVVFTVTSATSLSNRSRGQAQAPVLARFPPETDSQVPISEIEEDEVVVDEEVDNDGQLDGENAEDDEDEAIADFDADDEQAGGSSIQHREIYSVSTRDRKYLKILFFGEDA